MEQSQAEQIIHQVETDYDHIASHFSSTRHDAWPEFELLKTLLPTDNTEAVKLLDIGCGNGRLAAALPKLDYTGLDLSDELLKIARQHYPQYQFIHGSMMQLPFADASFDVVTCVAALQHIPSTFYRQHAIREMARVLKPGGYLFMLNWNLNEQVNYQRYNVSNKAGYDAGDYLIPWKNDQGVIQAERYYHGFQMTELTDLIEHAKLKIVKNEIGPDRRNIVTIAQH